MSEKETLLAALAASENHTAQTTLPNGTILRVEMHDGCFDVHHTFPGRPRSDLMDRLEVEAHQSGMMDNPVWEAQ